MSIEVTIEKAAGFMSQRGWKRLIAKRRGYNQSLFEHSMVELDAILSIIPILKETTHFALTQEENQILIASVIAHDVGKEKAEWQEYVLAKRGFVSDVDPDLTQRVIPEICSALGYSGITEPVQHVIENCINLHMRHERGDANVVSALLRGGDRWKTLADLVDAIDNICSAKGLLGALSALERSILNLHLKTAYHQVVLRGVSTPMVHRACVETYMGKGWAPILYFHHS